MSAARAPRAARSRDGIPDATVARLPVYLRALLAYSERGTATVSSEELAAAAGVNSAKLRKDLSYLGSYGTRGVGYDVAYLVYQISRELGLTQDWACVIVGVGSLGHALANYGGFSSRGFRIVALVDADPARVGETLAGVVINPLEDLESIIAARGVTIGVIATPGTAAQDVCDRLVAAGVTSILNFAPVVLNVPDGVDVRKVDLSVELQILAFHAQRKSLRDSERPARRSSRRSGAAARKDAARKDAARKDAAAKDVARNDVTGAAAGTEAGTGPHADPHVDPLIDPHTEPHAESRTSPRSEPRSESPLAEVVPG